MTTAGPTARQQHDSSSGHRAYSMTTAGPTT